MACPFEGTRGDETANMSKKTLDSNKGSWGGRRAGAGAKPKKKIRGGVHSGRPPFTAKQPLYVALVADEGLPSMRARKSLIAAHVSLARQSGRFGFRIVHYHIEKNHLHMVVEAKDRESLGRGMKGLGIRLAKALNRAWGRKGAVFSERYLSQVLSSASEVDAVLDGLAERKRRDGVQCSSEAWLRDEEGGLGLRELAREEDIEPGVPKTKLLIDAGKKKRR